jgi:hypothetical protein
MRLSHDPHSDHDCYSRGIQSRDAEGIRRLSSSNQGWRKVGRQVQWGTHGHGDTGMHRWCSCLEGNVRKPSHGDTLAREIDRSACLQDIVHCARSLCRLRLCWDHARIDNWDRMGIYLHQWSVNSVETYRLTIVSSDCSNLRS